MLGVMQETTVIRHLAGVLLVAATVAGWVRVQSYVMDLRAREHSSRWASNLRDMINFGCALAVMAAFWCIGLPLPAAFLFAGTVGIAIDLLRHTAAGEIARQRVAMVVALGLSLGLGIFPEAALSACNALATGLFHRG